MPHTTEPTPTGPSLYDDPEAGLEAALALYSQQRQIALEKERTSYTKWRRTDETR